MLDLCDIKF